MTPFYAALNYNYHQSQFQSSLGEDYACFLVWKSAWEYRDAIRDLLKEEFEILLETEIVWSDSNFHDNAARLYEMPILKTIEKLNRKTIHAKKIGANNFYLFIVKDVKPHYNYAISVSNKVELSNLNVVKAKYTIRDWVKDAKNVKFAVHSTNNIQEFFFQVPLLLGVELFEKLLSGENLNVPKIHKDLEGADGWNDYASLFKVLNYTSNYLVQRGFEELPFKNEDKDIDFLTDNFQRLASAIGMSQSKYFSYKGHVMIANEKVNIDLRFLGDDYYTTNWAKDMLESKVIHNGIFVPRNDYYFFSLLYHTKVQKKLVKTKYITILEELASDLNFNWFDVSILADDDKIGKILKGYFQSHGYYYKTPIDEGVICNEPVSKYLPKFALPTYSTKIKRKVAPLLPKTMLRFLKKILKK
jgi:hypothetical protein